MNEAAGMFGREMPYDGTSAFTAAHATDAEIEHVAQTVGRWLPGPFESTWTPLGWIHRGLEARQMPKESSR